MRLSALKMIGRRDTRYPGFQVKLWDGEARNYALTPDRLLAFALYETLKPDAPVDRFIAVLRYFVETGK